MNRTFTVTLEDLTEYSVNAEYEVAFENDCFSCWLEIKEVNPITDRFAVIDDFKLAEIESALSYLIVDECEDLSTYEQTRYE